MCINKQDVRDTLSYILLILQISSDLQRYPKLNHSTIRVPGGNPSNLSISMSTSSENEKVSMVSLLASPSCPLCLPDPLTLADLTIMLFATFRPSTPPSSYGFKTQKMLMLS